MSVAHKHHHWLRQEIERWVAEGVIRVAQGAELSQRYPVDEAPASACPQTGPVHKQVVSQMAQLRVKQSNY